MSTFTRSAACSPADSSLPWLRSITPKAVDAAFVANERLRWAGLPLTAQRVEPFKVFDNLYYVGVGYTASWLITTDAGLILIDAVDQRYADHVIAGNEYLAEWLQSANDRVTIVPSLVSALHVFSPSSVSGTLIAILSAIFRSTWASRIIPS